MKRIIYIEKIPSTDSRLKRHINHDSKSKEFAFDTSNIPTILDVEHERYIPILDQGQVGSCTGNAGIGSLSTAPFQNLNNTVYTRDEGGALALYSDAEMIDGDGPYPPNDNGSSGLSIAKDLLAKGLISGFQHTFTLQDALKALNQYTLLIGSNWYEGMFYPDANGQVHVDVTQQIAGGHEYLVRKNNTEDGLVGADNSWGEEWGIQGSFTMSWADLETLLAQGGDVIVLFPPTITPPTPVTKPRTLRLKSPMMTGPDVTALQNKLNAITPRSAIVIEGVFDSATKALVESFQHSKGLRVDGIFGPITYAALYNPA